MDFINFINTIKGKTLLHTQYFKNTIFQLRDDKDFNRLALEIFHFQAEHNPVYRDYLKYLNIAPSSITHLDDIPHIPIRFFKSHKVTIYEKSKHFFSSSGTTNSVNSHHYIDDIVHYEISFLKTYRQFIGNPEDQCIIALLPSYLERKGSSLIYMANKLIQTSADSDSGFFLNEWDKLTRLLAHKKKEGKETVLIGVSFALLELAENYPMDLSGIRIIETGGMKGRRKEMIRQELHKILREAFHVESIASEYGMTELLSQAYALKEGIFRTPPWMKVSVRSINDPFTKLPVGKSGGLNIIDLANLESCAFLETEDLGRMHADDSFEVIGRFDNADLRGCNLMMI